jgi:hypothetical protein
MPDWGVSITHLARVSHGLPATLKQGVKLVCWQDTWLSF